ncbi:MAG: hypothetical protein N2C14_21310 [Planctomycetales bacterium]
MSPDEIRVKFRRRRLARRSISNSPGQERRDACDSDQDRGD